MEPSAASETPLLFEATFLNVQYFFLQVYEFFQSGFSGGGKLGAAMREILFGAEIILGILGTLAAFGIFWYLFKLHELRAEEDAKWNFAEPTEEMGEQRNERWEHVQELLSSDNENDWRQAIIEADIMLETIVERMGYEGETLSDRLKQVEESDFLTLNEAWEAHKVRNKIAHEGTSFSLSRREARRVIGLYENVFKEFQYV